MKLGGVLSPFLKWCLSIYPWELLSVEKHTGIWLTESKAMVPTASVSGLYFSHPDARYFAVGKLNRDQVSDYARRKGFALADMERWLAPNLAYEPGEYVGDQHLADCSRIVAIFNRYFDNFISPNMIW